MNEQLQNIVTNDALILLKQLIAIPSYSMEEDKTAGLLAHFLQSKGVYANRFLNNIWSANKHFDANKPSLLLNSHHDTVKPNKAYSLDPFTAIEKEGKLFGLGSNDAGGSLVALMAVFLYFYEEKDLAYNLIFAATAEEEISGKNGIEVLLAELPTIECGIVGEPTQMQMAIAERGLLVLEVTAKGIAGHAAREEGENALYKALPDIEWFRNYRFEKVSPLLGQVKMTVTVIETENKAHNVIPSQCRFVVDVRVNELYTFEEILTTIRSNIQSEVAPRSLRMRSTAISMEHPLVKAGLLLGRGYYGSPTTSDKALMPFPTLKIGPGNSARSHTADEYLYIDEIREGIELYIELLKKVIV
ncbi:MAG: M20 family metallo-hydrolase [Chitinophagaceae bacterium]|nr:M20 family metallo-hydrolase [Chitinophagaceae bacterium]MDP1764192.1 M20 family metallo-hydrolase [Sediminibacterium sp.]MDP1810893.1 M20 family metallo-hydrolase [Sediminibacterium sp.]MDP3128990.1 M20 family metallo-hydrolase [Sediminibacterium sp.]MDP3667785.1 M20 family metallo-hydrolase [Sediminibacterium sp.]